MCRALPRPFFLIMERVALASVKTDAVMEDPRSLNKLDRPSASAVALTQPYSSASADDNATDPEPASEAGVDSDDDPGSDANSVEPLDLIDE